MTTRIYDNNGWRTKRGPYTDSFWQWLVLPLIAPVFIIFGIYLLYCSYTENQKIVGSNGWKLAPCIISAVHTAPYQKNYFEIQTIFFQNAQIEYSYSVKGTSYPGVLTLVPQGPRYYPDFHTFQDSGDCLEGNAINQKYEKLYHYAPIGGWTQPRTSFEAAAPFRFASLAPEHELFVRYDPENPKASVIAEVLQEHSQRIFTWGVGSLLIGILVITIVRMMRWAEDATESSDEAINELYARMNPDERL